MSAAPVPPASARALNCTNCGAPLTIRSGANALTVVCIQCCSVLDAKDPALGVLQTFQARARIQPKIPLGKRGKLEGGEWEAIGFQERTITVEGIHYSWYEYLLFNPYKGYRYLSEYRGHWNLGRTLRSLPVAATSKSKPAARVGAETFIHFQTAVASTTYVMGEFPWRVKVGETVEAADYIAPPKMLSAETTPEEVVWSMAQYTPGAEIWQAFALPGRAPAADGVFANQPSPFAGRVRSAWRLFLAFFVALFALMLLVAMVARNEQVFSGTYHFSPRAGGEASFVTPVFELQGHTSNVELEVATDLSNNWSYFGFALINESTGRGVRFRPRGEQLFGARQRWRLDRRQRQGHGRHTERSTGPLLFARRAGNGRLGDFGELQNRHPARRAVDGMVRRGAAVAADPAHCDLVPVVAIRDRAVAGKRLRDVEFRQ